MKNQRGITLIALVITIIVLLILAGVSINLVVGQNGIISRAQEASMLQKYTIYLEDLEMSLAYERMENRDFNPESINVFGDDLESDKLYELYKSYIPNFKKEDLGKVAIIGGKLYLLEENLLDANTAEQLEIFIEPNKENAEKLVEKFEEISLIKSTQEKHGIALKSKEANSTDWKIVTKISNGSVSETYGTGYYYLKAGSLIGEDRTLANSYLVDYSDLNNIKVINANLTANDSYTYLDINSTLGITENLIFNMDAKSMEKDGNGQYNWGDGVILKSTTLSEDEIDADNYISDNKFVFDGTNYIEIENDNGFNFTNGITLEIFGNIKGNTPGEVDGTTSFAPLLGIYLKGADPNTRAMTVRSFIVAKNSIFYNLGGTGKKWDNGWPNGEGSTWNQQLIIDSNSIFNKDTYLSVIISPEHYNGDERYITQTIYYNGSVLGESYLDIGYWNEFLTYDLGTVSFARGQMTKALNKMNLIGDIYAARIYNKALTENEVNTNYNSTLSYYQNVTE